MDAPVDESDSSEISSVIQIVPSALVAGEDTGSIVVSELNSSVGVTSLTVSPPAPSPSPSPPPPPPPSGGVGTSDEPPPSETEGLPTQGRSADEVSATELANPTGTFPASPLPIPTGAGDLTTHASAAAKTENPTDVSNVHTASPAPASGIIDSASTASEPINSSPQFINLPDAVIASPPNENPVNSTTALPPPTVLDNNHHAIASSSSQPPPHSPGPSPPAYATTTSTMSSFPGLIQNQLVPPLLSCDKRSNEEEQDLHNYVEVINTQASIHGSWRIATWLHVPLESLSPQEAGQIRANFNAESVNGGVEVEVELVERGVGGGDVGVGGERAVLRGQSSRGDVVFRVLKPDSQKADIRCSSQTGSVTVYLPRTFHGPITAKSTWGSIVLSDGIDRRAKGTSSNTNNGNSKGYRKCFLTSQVTRLDRTEAEEGEPPPQSHPPLESSWTGDELYAESTTGTVCVLFVDEQLPSMAAERSRRIRTSNSNLLKLSRLRKGCSRLLCGLI